MIGNSAHPSSNVRPNVNRAQEHQAVAWCFRASGRAIFRARTDLNFAATFCILNRMATGYTGYVAVVYVRRLISRIYGTFQRYRFCYLLSSS